jgi:hypothetical protein
VTRKKAGALKMIMDNAQSYRFVHIAMCGHGTRGSLVMTDRQQLKVSDVIDTLTAAGFTGHALITLNACDADTDHLAVDAPDWRGIAQFQWTFIGSSEGAQKDSNANHFARMISLVDPIICDGIEAASDLPRVVKAAWKLTTDKNQSPSHWIPCPTVISSALKNVPSVMDELPEVKAEMDAIGDQKLSLEEIREIFEEAFGSGAMQKLQKIRENRKLTPLEQRIKALADARFPPPPPPPPRSAEEGQCSSSGTCLG